MRVRTLKRVSRFQRLAVEVSRIRGHLQSGKPDENSNDVGRRSFVFGIDSRMMDGKIAADVASHMTIEISRDICHHVDLKMRLRSRGQMA